MKREDIFKRLFEFEFCEPGEKAVNEKAFNDILNEACDQTKKPLYILKPAILKLYPAYRTLRLGKEMPQIPFSTRGN